MCNYVVERLNLVFQGHAEIEACEHYSMVSIGVFNMLTGHLLIVKFTPLKERLTFVFNLSLCGSY